MTEKNTSWGAIAGWYDELVEDTADSYQKNVLMPNLIRLIGPKNGMKILDVACGQGYFARAFANNGADVVACDISVELIKLANGHKSDRLLPVDKGGTRERRGIKGQEIIMSKKTAMVSGKIEGKLDRSTGQPNRGNIEYQVALSDRLPFVADDSIDVAVIVLALQNIEKLSETIAECSRTLKTGGKLIVVLNHPAFRIPKNSSWRWEDENAKLKNQNGKLLPNAQITNENGSKMFRRIDSYMSDAQFRVDMTPGEKATGKKQFTVSFHRPLQSYFKAISKAGLAVTRLEEWISHKKSQSGPRGAEEDRMRKEIPMFLMIEAMKF